MLSYCQRAIDRSEILVGEWLEKYMHLDHNKAAAAAKWLASHDEHRSHGRPINAERAAAKGLNIKMLEQDNILQDKILSVYHAIILTFNRTDCVKIIESHLKQGAYTRVQIQQIPGAPNLPPNPPAPPFGVRPPPPAGNPNSPAPSGSQPPVVPPKNS